MDRAAFDQFIKNLGKNKQPAKAKQEDEPQLATVAKLPRASKASKSANYEVTRNLGGNAEPWPWSMDTGSRRAM
jgi:hypothetical protein